MTTNRDHTHLEETVPEGDINVGTRVYVSHPLGTNQATGTVTRVWKQRTITNGKIVDIPYAQVAFAGGDCHDYPMSWLTCAVDETSLRDSSCPQCSFPAPDIAVDVIMKTKNGTSQIATMRCKACNYVGHPTIRTISSGGPDD
jgi:hypothetical protein